MELRSRYSTGHAVSNTALSEAVTGFEASWVSQSWYPDTIRGDQAFQIGAFKKHIDKLGIVISPVPPGRHSKNPIESKHNTIRSIFIRLKADEDENYDPVLAAYKAVSISNDLYGNDIMSAFELPKGFSPPVMAKPHDTVVPNKIQEARDQLQARRKMAIILRSKAVKEIPFSIGDNVEIYQKKDNEKRGKWSDAKPILSTNIAARTLTVPGRNGKEITVAIEDARQAVPQQSFAQLVQEGLDAISDVTIEHLDVSAGSGNNDALEAPGNTETETHLLSETGPPNDSDFGSDDANNVPNVGDNISVFYPKKKVVV